jgi:hypothetical protein
MHTIQVYSSDGVCLKYLISLFEFFTLIMDPSIHCRQRAPVGIDLSSSGTSQLGRMYVNKHCVFYCFKSKTIHGGTPVQTIMYISATKGLCTLITHSKKLKE